MLAGAEAATESPAFVGRPRPEVRAVVVADRRPPRITYPKGKPMVAYVTWFGPCPEKACRETKAHRHAYRMTQRITIGKRIDGDLRRE